MFHVHNIRAFTAEYATFDCDSISFLCTRMTHTYQSLLILIQVRHSEERDESILCEVQ